jgi:mRNA degradation ribonuclease J1/J2
LNVTIHRGGRQIGGNCVEVSTTSTRLILDVGLPLEDPAELIDRPPEKTLRSDRHARPVALPNVPGLFSDGPHVDGVVLSHAHGDHTGLLQWLPVLMVMILGFVSPKDGSNPYKEWHGVAYLQKNGEAKHAKQIIEELGCSPRDLLSYAFRMWINTTNNDSVRQHE